MRVFLARAADFGEAEFFDLAGGQSLVGGLKTGEFSLQTGTAVLGGGELVLEVGDFNRDRFEAGFEVTEGFGEFGRGAVDCNLLIAQGGLEGGLGGLDFRLQVGSEFFIGGRGGGSVAFFLNLGHEAFDLESSGLDSAIDLLTVRPLVHV